jgi:hypothetical protein
MTPRLGGKAPATGSGWRAEGPGIGAGPGDPAGRGGPPVSRWPIRSERSGSRVRASGVGAGAHLHNDKLPAIGSGVSKSRRNLSPFFRGASEMGPSVDWRVKVGRNGLKCYNKWRTRRDSNSRPLPSEGSALSS